MYLDGIGVLGFSTAGVERLTISSTGITVVGTGTATDWVTTSDMRLKDKVALITGASSGIGKASAKLFAAEGANVVIADVNDEGAQQAMKEILSEGHEASFIYADVSKEDDCRMMVEHTEAKYGRVDILFNNAGIMDSRDDNAEVTDEETWDLTMNINAKGVFLGCKYGIPAIKRAGGGSIINTASFVMKPLMRCSKASIPALRRSWIDVG